ncbi:MAG: SBBP repeat-containing protein [Crocinitomicaceae bacterium]|nr:SBBP repeat-containing protein [Crocinitomicaceae bacterium]
MSTDGYLIFSGGTTGLASGTEIATSGSHQETAGGGGVAGSGAYLAKFDTSGTRIWATYYGGSSSETSRSCNFDNKGNIYLVGSTQSDDSLAISTIDGHQPNFSGEYDAYIAMFDSSGLDNGVLIMAAFTEEGWGVHLILRGMFIYLGFVLQLLNLV